MSSTRSPPWNFSWIIKDALCACAWPQTKLNIDFLRGQGVGHLVTLSDEKMPHPIVTSMMSHHLISVEEFEAPSIEDIERFIAICQSALNEKKAVCVHCRMGRGRTGTMLAAYLVKFYNQPPQTAITNIRLMRPGSVETYEQERIIKEYWDHLAWSLNK